MMRRNALALFRAVALALPAALVGCPGTTTGVSCTRHPDGRVECSVEVHRDGKHDKPVK